MSLSLRLDVKQTQNLVLTPQLQQAIKLLQCSNQELIGTIQREAAENPFLEMVEPGLAVANASNGHADKTVGLTQQAPVLAPSNSAAEPGEWDAPAVAIASDCRLRLRRTAGDRTGEATSALDRLSETPTLAAHLSRQVGAAAAPEGVRALAIALLGYLDDDGYLREKDDELAEQLRTTTDAVGEARRLIQCCEPAGVGARDLAGCLALQLAESNRLDPAMQALLDRLPALARADWPALERACGVDRDDLVEMVAEIKALDPRPGRQLAPQLSETVVPDLVIVAKRAGGWRIELNHHALPRVQVDQAYAAEISASGPDPESRAFVSEKLQSANWLQKALEQRARTMVRVAKAIFQHQRGFLERGPSGLRPLVLREIAEATNLHESTVSRATAEKYIQTPLGTFPLKYFFTTALQSTGGGEDHSAEAIRSLIKALVAQETAKTVLSDDQIVKALADKGIVIARRTVAKYREAMGIDSSVQRRRAKALAG